MAVIFLVICYENQDKYWKIKIFFIEQIDADGILVSALWSWYPSQ